MKCPVCESNLNAPLCSCGYDASKDYAKYPTLGPVGKAAPASALRARRAPRDALRCEKCGSTDFTICIPDNTRWCSKCGWSPDEAALLKCVCGSRYFTVRPRDGMLICPLCAAVRPLVSLLSGVLEPARFPAAPVRPSSRPMVTAIATGASHTVALYSDGTAAAIGSNSLHQCEVSQWRDLVAIAAGGAMTVGLKRDGTVLSAGTDRFGQLATGKWRSISAIATGNGHTVGLRADGTVIAVGQSKRNQCSLAAQWKNIRSISTDGTQIIGVRGDGRVISAGIYYQKNAAVMMALQHWRSITAVCAASSRVYGLHENGTVSAAGDSRGCDTSKWTHITAIAAGSFHTLGLRSDGTVVATGENNHGQCNVTDWYEITAISAGSNHSVGLKRDGTLVATGNNESGQCDVDKLIKR